MWTKKGKNKGIKTGGGGIWTLLRPSLLLSFPSPCICISPQKVVLFSLKRICSKIPPRKKSEEPSVCWTAVFRAGKTEELSSVVPPFTSPFRRRRISTPQRPLLFLLSSVSAPVALVLLGPDSGSRREREIGDFDSAALFWAERIYESDGRRSVGRQKYVPVHAPTLNPLSLLLAFCTDSPPSLFLCLPLSPSHAPRAGRDSPSPMNIISRANEVQYSA